MSKTYRTNKDSDRKFDSQIPQQRKNSMMKRPLDFNRLAKRPEKYDPKYDTAGA